MQVLGRVTSINVRKVLWALDELGESYEREDWGLPLRDPNVPEFTALNPNAQIPVFIDDDGVTLWESNAILLYLAKTRSALMPTEKGAHGFALQWLVWQTSELGPAWGYAFHALSRKTPGYDDPAKIAASVALWTKRMAILEAELAKGAAFIAGDEFSVADAVLGLSVHRWLRTPLDHGTLPHVEAYYERLRQRPAAAPWMPDDIA